MPNDLHRSALLNTLELTAVEIKNILDDIKSLSANKQASTNANSRLLPLLERIEAIWPKLTLRHEDKKIILDTTLSYRDAVIELLFDSVRSNTNNDNFTFDERHTKRISILFSSFKLLIENYEIESIESDIAFFLERTRILHPYFTNQIESHVIQIFESVRNQTHMQYLLFLLTCFSLEKKDFAIPIDIKFNFIQVCWILLGRPLIDEIQDSNSTQLEKLVLEKASTGEISPEIYRKLINCLISYFYIDEKITKTPQDSIVSQFFQRFLSKLIENLRRSKLLQNECGLYHAYLEIFIFLYDSNSSFIFEEAIKMAETGIRSYIDNRKVLDVRTLSSFHFFLTDVCNTLKQRNLEQFYQVRRLLNIVLAAILKLWKNPFFEDRENNSLFNRLDLLIIRNTYELSVRTGIDEFSKICELPLDTTTDSNIGSRIDNLPVDQFLLYIKNAPKVIKSLQQEKNLDQQEVSLTLDSLKDGMKAIFTIATESEKKSSFEVQKLSRKARLPKKTSFDRKIKEDHELGLCVYSLHLNGRLQIDDATYLHYYFYGLYCLFRVELLSDELIQQKFYDSRELISGLCTVSEALVQKHKNKYFKFIPEIFFNHMEDALNQLFERRREIEPKLLLEAFCQFYLIIKNIVSINGNKTEEHLSEIKRLSDVSRKLIITYVEMQSKLYIFSNRYKQAILSIPEFIHQHANTLLNNIKVKMLKLKKNNNTRFLRIEIKSLMALIDNCLGTLQEWAESNEQLSHLWPQRTSTKKKSISSEIGLSGAPLMLQRIEGLRKSVFELKNELHPTPAETRDIKEAIKDMDEDTSITDADDLPPSKSVIPKLEKPDHLFSKESKTVSLPDTAVVPSMQSSEPWKLVTTKRTTKVHKPTLKRQSKKTGNRTSSNKSQATFFPEAVATKPDSNKLSKRNSAKKHSPHQTKKIENIDHPSSINDEAEHQQAVTISNPVTQNLALPEVDTVQLDEAIQMPSESGSSLTIFSAPPRYNPNFYGPRIHNTENISVRIFLKVIIPANSELPPNQFLADPSVDNEFFYIVKLEPDEYYPGTLKVCGKHEKRFEKVAPQIFGQKIIEVSEYLKLGGCLAPEIPMPSENYLNT